MARKWRELESKNRKQKSTGRVRGRFHSIYLQQRTHRHHIFNHPKTRRQEKRDRQKELTKKINLQAAGCQWVGIQKPSLWQAWPPSLLSGEGLWQSTFLSCSQSPCRCQCPEGFVSPVWDSKPSAREVRHRDGPASLTGQLAPTAEQTVPRLPMGRKRCVMATGWPSVQQGEITAL